MQTARCMFLLPLSILQSERQMKFVNNLLKNTYLLLVNWKHQQSRYYWRIFLPYKCWFEQQRNFIAYVYSTGKGLHSMKHLIIMLIYDFYLHSKISRFKSLDMFLTYDLEIWCICKSTLQWERRLLTSVSCKIKLDSTIVPSNYSWKP